MARLRQYSLLVLVCEMLLACEPFAIETQRLPTGKTDIPYFSQLDDRNALQLSIVGGTAPYAVAVKDGALPADLKMSPEGKIFGVISAQMGTYRFTVEVVDSDNPPRSLVAHKGHAKHNRTRWGTPHGL